MRTKYLSIIVLVNMVLFRFPSVSGQNGEWIAQTLDAGMSGNWLIDAGESVAIITRNTARYVYFFDIKSSQWSVLDCGTAHNFTYCIARGDVALVFGQKLLAAFSGVSSSWDTIYFKGDPLDLNPSTGDPSWGCSNKLGWFVTTTRIYIFDAEEGKWKETTYNPGLSYVSGNGRFWAGTNYAGIVLSDADHNVYFNAAYSLIHHKFAILNYGGFYDHNEWDFDNGFVSYWNQGSNYRFFGYSTYTNNFDMLEVIPTTGLPLISAPKNLVKTKTVYMVYSREIISLPSLYRMDMYGFDTRTGNWMLKQWKYDADKWKISPVKLGGQFAAVDLINEKDSCFKWIYSGEGGSFNFVRTELKAVPEGGLTPVYSGTAAADIDLFNVSFLPALSGIPTLVPGSRDYLFGSTAGENFNILTFTYPGNTSSMNLVAFNSKNTSVKITEVPYQTGSLKGSPWMMMFRTSGTKNEVFCYSGITHDYKLIPFTAETIIYSYNVNNVLASVETSDQLVLYDATSNVYHSVPRPAGGVKFALGEYAALVKLGTNSVRTYSVSTGTWKEETLTESISDVLCSRYTGLITTPAIANKIYAYNGIDGQLVPLSMDGTTVLGGLKLGGLTAVITRNTVAYAFTPKSGTVNVNSPEIFSGESDGSLKVYPNPSSGKVFIEAEILSRSVIEIIVTDLTGRVVHRQVTMVPEPGKYLWTWDGSDQSKMHLKSGFYIIKVKAGTKIATSKIMYVTSG